MSRASEHKGSGQADAADAAAGTDVAATDTLPGTVDAASSEAVKLAQRRALVELLSTPGVLDLDDPDVMAGAWR